MTGTRTLSGFVVAMVLGVALVAASLEVPTLPASGATNDPVIGAVGDMACDPADPAFNDGGGTSARCAEQRVSDRMLADTSLQAVLGLGDYQYECDDAGDFAASYTPTWGRLNPLLEPVAGNHEYQTGTDRFGTPCPAGNSAGDTYFDYFGAAAHPETAGHFSFDLGAWHLVALNANCSQSGVGGCSATSAQTTWLKADLAATTQPCILAFWHQPYWTGRGTGKAKTYTAWWKALYAAHADVVLNGHVHNYQRFASLAPDGTTDSGAGITEYIAGTGGEQRIPVSATAAPQPVFWARSFGYLRMTLQQTGWLAQFINANGSILDSSSGTCH